MALSHAGYDFEGSNLHGDIVPVGLFEPRLLVENFFGVIGEAHLWGEKGGRDLVCDYMLSNFVSSSALQTAIDAIDAQAGELVGTLTISGNISGSYPFSIFVGYERQRMFFDGSGVNGWSCEGRLRWRQRKP